MEVDSPYQNYAKSFYFMLYSQNHFWNFKQVGSGTGKHTGNTIESTVFHLFDNLPLNIA